MSWAWDVFLPIIPAVDLLSDYVVLGTIIWEEGIWGIWKDPVLNLGIGLFLTSQFVIRVGNESSSFQRCMACWELFLLFYVIMMGCRFVRLLLAPLDMVLSYVVHLTKKSNKKENKNKKSNSSSRKRNDATIEDEEEEEEENKKNQFRLVLFRPLCKCEFGKLQDYFLSQPWYMQYYQTFTALGGGGRWLVTIFFPWYFDHYDEVQRAEMDSRRQAGWTGFCCRNCCCCCCKPGELNPVVSSVLAIVEEVMQNTGGLLISYAILRREYPSEESTSLGQAAMTRARISLICSVLSTIFETCYLLGMLRGILKEHWHRRQQQRSNRTTASNV